MPEHVEGYQLGPDHTMQDVLDVQEKLLASEGFPKRSGGSLIPEGIETALRRLRVASTEAQMVSEAPSARAYEDIRIAHAKPEAIDPKGTGESLTDSFTARLTHLADDFEIDLARRRTKPPDNIDQFKHWAKYVYSSRNDKTGKPYTAYYLSKREGCSITLILKALKIGQRLEVSRKLREQPALP